MSLSAIEAARKALYRLCKEVGVEPREHMRSNGRSRMEVVFDILSAAKTPVTAENTETAMFCFDSALSRVPFFEELGENHLNLPLPNEIDVVRACRGPVSREYLGKQYARFVRLRAKPARKDQRQARKAASESDSADNGPRRKKPRKLLSESDDDDDFVVYSSDSESADKEIKPPELMSQILDHCNQILDEVRRGTDRCNQILELVRRQ